MGHRMTNVAIHVVVLYRIIASGTIGSRNSISAAMAHPRDSRRHQACANHAKVHSRISRRRNDAAHAWRFRLRKWRYNEVRSTLAFQWPLLDEHVSRSMQPEPAFHPSNSITDSIYRCKKLRSQLAACTIGNYVSRSAGIIYIRYK